MTAADAAGYSPDTVPTFTAKPAIALAVVALGVAQVVDVRMPSLALPLGLSAPRSVPVAVAVFL